MKKLSVTLLAALALSACKVGPLDFTGSLAINNEVVFTTTSSIDEMKADTSDGSDTFDGGAGMDQHNGTDTEYAKTKYPIVLVHGLYGFDQMLGIDYWYRVVEALELGGATVYTIPVPKLNTTEVRGEHLLEGLRDLQAATGHDKFHLMGHSHGGPTVRYIITADPTLLASVTTIAGVNVYGSETTEDFMDTLTSFFTGPLLQGMLNGLAELIEALGGNKENHQSYAVGSFESLSKAGIYAYNQTHNHGLPTGWNDGSYLTGCAANPSDFAANSGDASANIGLNSDPVLFFSWSGIGVKTNVLDPIDILVAYVGETVGSPSDGMVEQCSSHFGTVLRSDYDLNHLDVMNWAFGLRKASSTNPLVIYRQIANRLKHLETTYSL